MAVAQQREQQGQSWLSSSVAHWILTLLLLGVVGVLDVLRPYGISLSIFYLVPAVYGAVVFSQRQFLALAGVIVAAVFLVPLLSRDNGLDSKRLTNRASGITLGLLVAVLLAERRRREHDLQEANAHLEERVAERTQQLLTANDGLRVMMIRQQGVEAQLRDNEERYRRMLDYLPVGVVVHDGEHIYYGNTAARNILGVPDLETLLQVPPLSIVAPEYQRLARGRIEFILRTGEPLPTAEAQVVRRDGSLCDVEVNTLRTSYNGRNCVQVHFYEISERKRAESQLRESEASLRRVLENLENVAVQACELDGRLTFWNRGSERLYGFMASEALGRDLLELTFGEAAGDAEAREQELLVHKGRLPPAKELEVRHRDGRKLHVFSSWSQRLRPGRSPELFCFDVDITARKLAEQELAVRQVEMLHAARLSTVGQMVAALSHEVAQPLNAIGNFAAAAEKISQAETQAEPQLIQECLAAIIQQSRRCSEILSRLRDFSRRSAPRRTVQNLNAIVRESLELLDSDLRRQHVAVSFLPAAGTMPVVADRIQIQQVVVNLLTNARDAVLGRSNERRITVATATSGGAVSFTVTDNGHGLKDSELTKIFDPFFTTKDAGMGIGLSICRSILQDHGGSITAGNLPGGGAQFVVHLPRAEEVAPAETGLMKIGS